MLLLQSRQIELQHSPQLRLLPKSIPKSKRSRPIQVIFCQHVFEKWSIVSVTWRVQSISSSSKSWPRLAIHSRNSHPEVEIRSDDSSSHSSKQRTSSSVPYSSSSHKSSKEPSSMQRTESTSTQASSSRMSYTSHTTTVSGFNTDANTDASNQMANPDIDLSGMSAWTNTQPYQTPALAHTSYDTGSTSTCPYHVSMMESDNHTARSRSGHCFAALELWLEEDTREGGQLPLHFGLQLRADCTCNAMQDGADWTI